MRAYAEKRAAKSRADAAGRSRRRSDEDDDELTLFLSCQDGHGKKSLAHELESEEDADQWIKSSTVVL